MTIGPGQTINVHVVIDADAAGLSRGAGQTDSAFGRMGRSAGAAGAAVASGMAVAGVAIGAVALDAISMASDLQETLSKNEVIFGEHAAAMEQWADGAARSMGLSKTEALTAATAFGDMFQQIGFSGDQAVDMSRNVAQLAADLGSFNNLDTADVMDRISAAFRGEYDSLQLVIPNINAARVEQEALAATGKDAAKELTAQEKAAATLAIVQRDGARATGDFARTSDGLANQTKIATAELANMRAELGEKLLPIASEFMAFVLDTGLPTLQAFSEEAEARLAPVLADIAPHIENAARWIRDELIPAVEELAYWFFEEIVPGYEETLAPALDGLQQGFGYLAESVSENKPFFDDLLTIGKELAEFWAGTYMPVIGRLIGAGFIALGFALGVVVDYWAWMWNNGKHVVQFLGDLIPKTALLQVGSAALQLALAGIRTAFAWAVDRGEDVIGFFSGLADIATTLAAPFLSAASAVGDLIDGLREVSNMSLGDLAGAAAGLIPGLGRTVSGGTLGSTRFGQAADAIGPAAVVIDASTHITVDNSGGIANETELAEKIARLLANRQALLGPLADLDLGLGGVA